MESTFEYSDMNTAEGRAKAAACEAERVEQIESGQQLFAKIKKTSKYYGQGEPGALFPVSIDPATKWEYCVVGGPGGQYRLKDVNLFVVDGGCELQIS